MTQTGRTAKLLIRSKEHDERDKIMFNLAEGVSAGISGLQILEFEPVRNEINGGFHFFSPGGVSLGSRQGGDLDSVVQDVMGELRQLGVASRIARKDTGAVHLVW